MTRRAVYDVIHSQQGVVLQATRMDAEEIADSIMASMTVAVLQWQNGQLHIKHGELCCFDLQPMNPVHKAQWIYQTFGIVRHP